MLIIPKEKKILEVVMANLFVMFIKTQNYHWNVTGKTFYALHKMFEEMYKNRLEELDTVAEFLRISGTPVSSNFNFISDLSMIGAIQSGGIAKDMLQDLAGSHRTIIRFLYNAIAELENDGRVLAVDLLTEVGRAHQKDLWFVESHIKSEEE